MLLIPKKTWEVTQERLLSRLQEVLTGTSKVTPRTGILFNSTGRQDYPRLRRT